MVKEENSRALVSMCAKSDCLSIASNVSQKVWHLIDALNRSYQKEQREKCEKRKKRRKNKRRHKRRKHSQKGLGDGKTKVLFCSAGLKECNMESEVDD